MERAKRWRGTNAWGLDGKGNGQGGGKGNRQGGGEGREEGSSRGRGKGEKERVAESRMERMWCREMEWMREGREGGDWEKGEGFVIALIEDNLVGKKKKQLWDSSFK